MNIGLVIISVGVLLFTAHLLSALFKKTGVPDVLLLLFIGLAIGPIGGLVNEAQFGAVGAVFTTIALVGILFESGLGLDIKALTQGMLPALKVTIVNFVATLAAAVPIGIFALGLTTAESVILGSIIAGTSSAVVIPLVDKLGLMKRTATTLILESTVSDVLCIVVTLGILEAFTAESVEVAPMVGHSLASFLVPIVVGGLAGVFWSVALKRVRRLDNSISLTLAVVFIVYGICDAMDHSGAIGALSFGVLLGNIDALNNVVKRFDLGSVELTTHERDFYAEVAFIIKTFFFVYVGVVMPLDDSSALMIGAGITAILFAIRVLVVRLSLRSRISRAGAIVSAVMTPKGLAAAVLASLPVQAGLAGGETIQSVVFAIILFSIVATAVLCFFQGRGWLAFPYGLAFKSYPELVDEEGEAIIDTRLPAREEAALEAAIAEAVEADGPGALEMAEDPVEVAADRVDFGPTDLHLRPEESGRTDSGAVEEEAPDSPPAAGPEPGHESDAEARPTSTRRREERNDLTVPAELWEPE